jgi:hypothetical protein
MRGHQITGMWVDEAVAPPPHSCEAEAEETAGSKSYDGSFEVTVVCGVCGNLLSKYVDSVL